MKVSLMKSVVAGAVIALAGSAFAVTYASVEYEGYQWDCSIDGSVVSVYGVYPIPSGDVEIPPTVGGKSVTRLGDYLFSNCQQLQSIGIPGSVKEIGKGAFSDCIGLKESILPLNLVSIGEEAFKNCKSLVRIVLFNVTDLGAGAFTGCTALKSVDLPSRFAKTKSEHLAGYFSGCQQGIEFFYFLDGTAAGFFPKTAAGNHLLMYFSVLDDGSVQIGPGPDGTSAITNTEEIEKPLFLPNEIEGRKVTRIGDYAFRYCMIRGLSVPEGVEHIGQGAFYNCEILQKVTLPSTVKSWGQGVFSDCPVLRSVSLPIKAHGQEDSLFYNCPDLTRIVYRVTVGGKCYTMGDLSDDKYAMLYGIDPEPAGKLSIIGVAGYRFNKIDDLAFSECPDLTEVAISGTVVSIGNYAFRECTNLARVSIPSSVTEIGEDAFGECPALKTIVVKRGDVERVKALLEASGFNTDGVTFIESSTDKVDYDVDPESLDPFNPGELPCYEVLNPADIWDPLQITKAGSLFGAVYYGCDIVGVVELKLAKPKNYNSKASGSVTLNNGNKYTIKSQKFNFGSQYATSLNLTVNKLGSLRVAIGSIGGSNAFSGSLGRYHVQTAKVGGNWTRSDATADVSLGDLSAVPGTVLETLLPDTEPVAPSRGKWVFKKAASVKWTKVKPGIAALVTDAASGKGLVVDTSKGRTNRSALKLTYTPKSGIFKGSFKVYALQGSGKATKLKKYTVKVTGFVVDGSGAGLATCAKPAISGKLTIE